MLRAHARLGWLCCVLAACGASQRAPAVTAPSAPAGPSAAELAARHEREEEQARRDAEVAKHRKLEAEQQDALAATCDEPPPRTAHPRCLPSCYATEPADARTGAELPRAAAIEHLVCVARADPAGPLRTLDELGGKLGLRRVRGRFPRPHRKGTWQARLEARLETDQLPKPSPGDVFVVAGAWRTVTHPLTHERLRCVHVWHYLRPHAGAHYGCAANAGTTCEAAGNAAARGLNVVHYRLAEARRLQAAGKAAACQQAALEAIAVARGLPRWRQYQKLNVAHWVDHAAYRTRFDGTLDEDALFTTAAALGHEAERVYAACGGPAAAPTTPEQEQSFHTCW